MLETVEVGVDFLVSELVDAGHWVLDAQKVLFQQFFLVLSVFLHDFEGFALSIFD